MTIIKLNCNREIKGCEDCPFCRSDEDFNTWCSLNPQVNTMISEDHEHTGLVWWETNKNRPDDCPIMECEIK